MKFGAFFAGLAIACGLGAAGLSAQDTSTSDGKVNFAIGTDQFEMDLPEGFCVPQGSFADLARRMDAGDSQNETPVNIQDCASFGTNYILIKAPRGFPALPFPKPQFLELLAGELVKQEAIDAGSEIGIEDLRRTLNDQVEIDIGTIRFIGTDEDCAYMAGTISVSNAEGQTRTIQVGSCGTLVGNRHMFIHSYARTDLGLDHADLMERSKEVARGIRPR